MKTKLLLVVFALFATITFSQNTGIAVQGIARDAAKSAIGNKTLTFTFSIQSSAGEEKYKETQEITTDAFGVFSHIIGTGTPQGIAFNELDYATDHLKLVVSLDGAIILDQPFNYTPYAYHAKNGAPTGSIMPYVGATAPEGWLICDGSAIPNPTTSGKALIELLGGNNTPNLQGMFLRGTGMNPVNNMNGPALNTTQADDNKSHNHSATLTGATTTSGVHSHTYSRLTQNSSGWSYDSGGFYLTHKNNISSTDGHHNHNVSVSGNTANTGTESRPVNYGVNYIIKL